MIISKRTDHWKIVVLPDRYEDITVRLDKEWHQGWNLLDLVSYFDGKNLRNYAKFVYRWYGVPKEFNR